MESPLAVGDLVEVIACFEYPEWVGRRLVVSGFGCQHAGHMGEGGKPYTGLLVNTIPPCPWPPGATKCAHWNPANLRKIEPPDFTVPLTTDLEVSL